MMSNRMNMEKWEDEATSGNVVVTMRHMNKNKNKKIIKTNHF